MLAYFLSIAKVLSRIKDHLVPWTDQRMRARKLSGSLVPSSIISDLRDDAKVLQQYLLAVSFVAYPLLQGRSKAVMAVPEPSNLDSTRSANARESWRAMVGDHVRTFIKRQE